MSFFYCDEFRTLQDRIAWNGKHFSALSYCLFCVSFLDVATCSVLWKSSSCIHFSDVVQMLHWQWIFVFVNYINDNKCVHFMHLHSNLNVNYLCAILMFSMYVCNAHIILITIAFHDFCMRVCILCIGLSSYSQFSRRK